MIRDKLDQLFLAIRSDCLTLIQDKKIDMEDLAFDLGLSLNEFISRFQRRHSDFSFYLRTYRLLMER